MEPKLSKEEKRELQWRQDLKATVQQEQGREITEAELDNCANFMKTLAEIVVSNVLEEQRRRQKLKEYPDGFSFDKKGYSCQLCSGSASMENGWFDQHGLQCLHCHNAVAKGIIPGNLVGNDDLYYTEIRLELSLNVPIKIQRKWVKAGILKCRDIPDKDGKGKHMRLYLVADNKGFIPNPSILPKGGMVKETENGQEYFVFRPWWEFVEARNVLKNYGIAAYISSEPE